MATFSRLWRRFQRWLRSGLDPASDAFLEAEPTVNPSDPEPMRQKLEACNQALAAAVDARDGLRKQLAELACRRQLLEEHLQRSAASDDEQIGAMHALRLHELDAEEKELHQRAKEAQDRVDQLSLLRDHLIAPPV